MVGARRVDAVVLAARGVVDALVDVLAVRLDGGLRVALVAHALVRAHEVLAGAVAADARGDGALVHVLAGEAVGRQLHAGRALAAERARRVDAAPAAAQRRVLRALVHVCGTTTLVNVLSGKTQRRAFCHVTEQGN